MTHKIMKSAIAGVPDFAVQAASHAKEMRDWRAHMGRVASDEKAGVPREDAHHPFPAPRAHPLVEAAVNEDDEADFEIVDDGPTPDQILTSKKNTLLQAVSSAENDASGKVFPFAKRRLYNMKETAITTAEAAKLATILNSTSVLASLLSKIGLRKSTDDAVAKISKDRSPEDSTHLADQADRRSRIAAIEAAAAQMHSDIEDLTLDNIDAWKMPPFPGT